jgi:hypothetical protein
MSNSRVIWLTTLVYGLLYALATHTLGAEGIHWGNRFLLPLYPMFAVLAGENAAALVRRVDTGIAWRGLLVAAAVLVSVGAQVYSIDLLKEKKRVSRRLNETLKEFHEPVVITDVWWAGQTLHEEFYSKPMFFVGSRDQFAPLFERLAGRGYKRCVFVTQTSGDGWQGRVRRVEDERLGYFTLDFMTGSIRSPDS